MPVDLTSYNVIVNRGVLIQSDHLLILESQGVASRLWRVPFEQVTKVTATRGVPWLRAIFVPILPALLGLPFLIGAFTDPGNGMVLLLALGLFFMLLAACILGRYLVYGKTTLELHYGLGKHRKMNFVASPAKMRRFMSRLIDGIRTVQDNQWQAHLESAASHEAATPAGVEMALPPPLPSGPDVATDAPDAPALPPGAENA